MKYEAMSTIYSCDKCYPFWAYASSANAAVNKIRKRAKRNGLNELNSHGYIVIRKYKKIDKWPGFNNYYFADYYFIKTVSAWNTGKREQQ